MLITFGQTFPAPYDGPHDAENDASCGENPNYICCYSASAFGGVEKAVSVEPLGCMGEVGEAKVKCEDDDEEEEVEWRGRIGTGEKDLDEGEEGV